MKRVLVIANNLSQASYRLRIQALIEPLAQRGFQLHPVVRPRSIFARRRLLATAGDYDAVILQRKLLDPSDIKRLRGAAKKLYYDVDDAVMYGLSPGPLQRWLSWRRFLAIAKNADHVVAGSELLAELFRRHGAAASVLPTVVDLAHYSVKTHAATASPSLVWIGSKSTLRYLAYLRPALAQASEIIPGLKLIVIADAALDDAPLPVEFVAWSEQTEAASLCRGDIGIAPMPDDRWTRGKCGFKIVQYLAAGLPVVAAPVGGQSDLVSGDVGFLPREIADWPGVLKWLADDVEKRRAMGTAARGRTEKFYGIDRAVDQWEALLREA